MARKMYKRLTWPVFDGQGNQVHAPGDVFPVDAPLDPAARFEVFEADDPDEAGQQTPVPPAPEPGEDPPAVPSDAPRVRRKNATVTAQPAEGGGAAHP